MIPARIRTGLRSGRKGIKSQVSKHTKDMTTVTGIENLLGRMRPTATSQRINWMLLRVRVIAG